MKRIILPAIIAAAFAGFIFLAWKSYELSNARARARQAIQELPALDFKFIQEDYNYKHRPVIINHFAPDCTHCQYMAEKIGLRPGDFCHTSLIMITQARQQAVAAFLQKYKLDKLPFLSVAIDTAASFSRVFGTAVIPCFFVYDENHKLVKSIMGETRIDNLLH